MASSSLTPIPTNRAFDALAADYDAAFTDRVLGRWLRSMVWQHMADAFEPGQHVLELGCGTGEDAVWLAQRGVSVTATDAATRMLEMTRKKVDAAGVRDRVSVAQLDIEVLQRGRLTDAGNHPVLDTVFDGALSNFGPLNCVADRPALASNLARLVRPGGRLVLVLMGPLCPWEILWYLGHAHVRTAFRRFRSGHEAIVGGTPFRVWYPSLRRLARDFEPHFSLCTPAGIGLFLPPSELGGLVEKAPRAFALAAKLDLRMSRTLPWLVLNDHYLVVMERR